jgi:hypothetical protein
MYIRNIKQIIRAADANFDERRYGFGGLMDLLRACQKDGWIRMERDRRGGLRVFPGAALQRTTSSPSSLSQADVADAGQDQQPMIPVTADAADFEAQPAVDPTAEMLGRAKARRPRAKAAPEAAPKKRRAPSSSPRRGSRSKKSSANDEDSAGNV